MSENEIQLHSHSNSNSNTESSPFICEEYTRWSVEDVIKWCTSSLGLHDDSPLINGVRTNAINGELLDELTLEDCKELSEGDLSLAIRLKVLCNRVQQGVDRNMKLQEQEEQMVVALKNLYSAISIKLQEFQSQYTRLRGDVLEVVKTSNSSPRIPSQGHVSSQQQVAVNDNLNNAHHSGEFNISRRLSPHHLRPPHPNRSTSSHLVNETLTPLQGQSGSHHVPSSSEPLKQLRASKDDSCERILKNAMVRHNLSDQDWRGYVLVICYGDQERVLELDERPVIIFKNLRQQGMHPAIMLRRRGDFAEVDVNGDNVTPGGRL